MTLGKSSELLIASMLLAEDRELYMPAVDDRGVDMIVRTKNFSPTSSNPAEHYEFQTIQVKSMATGGLFAALKCPTPAPNYWFVFYIKEIKRLWLVNSMDLVNLSSAVTKVESKNYGKLTFDLKPCKRTPIKHPEFLITNFAKLP